MSENKLLKQDIDVIFDSRMALQAKRVQECLNKVDKLTVNGTAENILEELFSTVKFERVGHSEVTKLIISNLIHDRENFIRKNSYMPRSTIIETCFLIDRVKDDVRRGVIKENIMDTVSDVAGDVAYYGKEGAELVGQAVDTVASSAADLYNFVIDYTGDPITLFGNIIDVLIMAIPGDFGEDFDTNEFAQGIYDGALATMEPEDAADFKADIAIARFSISMGVIFSLIGLAGGIAGGAPGVIAEVITGVLELIIHFMIFLYYVYRMIKHTAQGRWIDVIFAGLDITTEMIAMAAAFPGAGEFLKPVTYGGDIATTAMKILVKVTNFLIKTINKAKPLMKSIIQISKSAGAMIDSMTLTKYIGQSGSRALKVGLFLGAAAYFFQDPEKNLSDIIQYSALFFGGKGVVSQLDDFVQTSIAKGVFPSEDLARQYAKAMEDAHKNLGGDEAQEVVENLKNASEIAESLQDAAYKIEKNIDKLINFMESSDLAKILMNTFDFKGMSGQEVIEGLKLLRENIRLLTSEAMGGLAAGGKLDPAKIKSYEIFDDHFPGLGGIVRLLEKSKMFDVKNVQELINSLTLMKIADDAKKGVSAGTADIGTSSAKATRMMDVADLAVDTKKMRSDIKDVSDNINAKLNSKEGKEVKEALEEADAVFDSGILKDMAEKNIQKNIKTYDSLGSFVGSYKINRGGTVYTAKELLKDNVEQLAKGAIDAKTFREEIQKIEGEVLDEMAATAKSRDKVVLPHQTEKMQDQFNKYRENIIKNFNKSLQKSDDFGVAVQSLTGLFSLMRQDVATHLNKSPFLTSKDLKAGKYPPIFGLPFKIDQAVSTTIRGKSIRGISQDIATSAKSSKEAKSDDFVKRLMNSVEEEIGGSAKIDSLTGGTTNETLGNISSAVTDARNARKINNAGERQARDLLSIRYLNSQLPIPLDYATITPTQIKKLADDNNYDIDINKIDIENFRSLQSGRVNFTDLSSPLIRSGDSMGKRISDYMTEVADSVFNSEFLKRSLVTYLIQRGELVTPGTVSYQFNKNKDLIITGMNHLYIAIAMHGFRTAEKYSVENVRDQLKGEALEIFDYLFKIASEQKAKAKDLAQKKGIISEDGDQAAEGEQAVEANITDELEIPIDDTGR